MVAEVRTRLKGYAMGSGGAGGLLGAIEDGESDDLTSIGWPRAALISAKSVRVTSWKSGSKRDVSHWKHQYSEEHTEKDVCLVDDDPLNILQS